MGGTEAFGSFVPEELFSLGEEIVISGEVYNEDFGENEEITATFDGYANSDGYLTFNFIQ